MKTLIVYNSKTGITKLFADEIDNFFRDNKNESKVISIDEFQDKDLKDVDRLLMGAWTHGLFIIFQHPEKKWVEFAGRLPKLNGIKVGLFTTYKIATGSMFNNMKRYLKGKTNNIKVQLKSKNGYLSEENKEKLNQLL